MVVSRKNYARASAVADVVNLLAPGTDRTDRFASVVRGLITGNMSEQKLSQAIFNMVPAANQQVANQYLQARAELAGPNIDQRRATELKLEIARMQEQLRANDKDASVRTAAVDQLVQEQHKTAAAASSIPNGSLDPQRSPSNAVIQYDLPQTQETVNPYGVATGRQLLHPGGGLQANRVEAR
jgi:thioredoxin-like negative regulator of GroEL